MRSFVLHQSTRGQLVMAGVHVLMLVVALLVAWGRNGPPAEKAFWAFLTYFVEIALVGVIEMASKAVRRSRRSP